MKHYEKDQLMRTEMELKMDIKNLKEELKTQKEVLTTFIAWSMMELGKDNAMKLLDMLEGKTGTPKSISE